LGTFFFTVKPLVCSFTRMSEHATGRLLLELLPPRKQSPRTPRSVPLYGGLDASPRPPATSIGASTSPRAPRKEATTPSWLNAGSKELPSERATARALRLTIARMSEAQPANARVQLLRATGLREEYHLLDSCIKQLVKQLATRCVEWGEVLEVVRGRLCSLWSRAWRSLQSLEATERPLADGAWLAKPAEQEGADAAGADAAAVDAAGVESAGAGAEEGLPPRLAAAAELPPGESSLVVGLQQPATGGAPANYAAAVEALARMEIRAVSAELALSEARQVRSVCAP
jgi:hypothetical protein